MSNARNCANLHATHAHGAKKRDKTLLARPGGKRSIAATASFIEPQSEESTSVVNTISVVGRDPEMVARAHKKIVAGNLELNTLVLGFQHMEHLCACRGVP